MEKIMAILVQEGDYARELSAFLSSREDFLYRPVAFSDVEAYLRFERENAVELLLCDRDMDPGEREGIPQNVCILSEYSTVNEDGEGRNCIFKYQSSEKLMQDILACVEPVKRGYTGEDHLRPETSAERYSAKRNAAEAGPGGFRTIGVCSPVGGSRCSTYAFALAEYLSKKGKTLFVSLDPFFEIPRTGGAGSRDLSELLYFLETRDAPEETLLENYICGGDGCSCIRRPSHWLDQEHLGKECLRSLARLAESSGFSNVVFDIGRPLEAATELLRVCSDVYVTRRKGKHDDTALAEWRRQLRSSGLSEIDEKIRERFVPDDKAADSVIDTGLLLAGSLGGYIRETEEFGYFG